MPTLKLGTTSTFVTFINWASLLSPGTTSKRPTTGSNSGGRNSNAAATSSRTRGERADARWAEGRRGVTVLAERKKQGFLPTQVTRGPFLFPRLSLPPSLPPFLPFPCPAFSCELARRVRRGANRIRNKTNPISKCAGPARGSNIQRSNWISRSFHFSLRVLFLLPPPARARRRRRHPGYLLTFLVAPPFAFRTISFVRDSPFLSLVDPSERDVERRDV